LHHYRRRALEGAIDEPVILALAGGEAVLGSEPVGPGVTLVRRAFDRGLTAFGDHALVFGWAVCALEAADLDTEALAHIDRALDQARPHGDAATIAHLLSYRTFIVCHAGRLAEAEADGRTALDLVQRFAGDVSFPLGLLDVLIERNQVEEAWRLASTPEMRGSAQRVAMVRLVSARVAVAAGEDKAGALAQLMQAGAELDELELRQPRFAPWRALAAPLAAELGQRELAQRLCGELAELAQASGAGTATALAARVQGALTEDLDTLAEACDAAGRTADVLEHAESLTALGTLQLKRGLRDAAKETLREALAVADEAGALRLREVARKALVTAGGRPRRAALRGVDALTPSELQVARLAAGGLSNRDISDTLFVALKTVEQHLARTYAKLGIPGRQQLAQALQ
jgi:ATP/maltotriose-dependent transcriptional regulator MalT